MKNYTAIYDTETMKDVQYSFKAQSMEEAVKFAKWKFTDLALESMTITEDK